MGKLRNRIFLVILISLIPIAVAIALGAYAVVDSHKEDVARLEAAVLLQKTQEVESFVDGQILGQTRVLVPYGPGIDVATSAQKFVLNETLAVLPFLESESFVDLAGKETARLDRAHPDGYKPAELRNMAEAPEFRVARGGDYYIGPVSYTARGPFVMFASPVKNDPGDIIAVIVGEASLEPVKKIVASAAIGETGYLYLVDDKGKAFGGGGPFGGGAGSKAPEVATLPIVQSALKGNDFLTAEAQMKYAGAGGEAVIAAAKYLPKYGWAMIAEWPTREADAIMNRLLVENLVATAAVLAVIFAASLFLAAHIVQPVRKLQEGAARVAEGKFSEGVLIKTGDELEALGESFNKMVQGLKQLEALKDEFVFIAAHELRTPVAAMKGYLSLILDGNAGAVTPETKAYVEKVIASDNRLVQLVNDLLEVARSEAGRLTIKVAPVEIGPSVRAVLDELKSLADEKSVKLIYEPPQNLPRVVGDADRIKEVMVNLVGNAVKYMGGGGTVTVSHEIKDGRLVTRVADTGVGISKDAQKKLFEKFYRVQNEKTRDVTGTGLGLFIVKQIMEKMNGKILAESEEGKGSVFSFDLPVA